MSSPIEMFDRASEQSVNTESLHFFYNICGGQSGRLINQFCGLEQLDMIEVRDERGAYAAGNIASLKDTVPRFQIGNVLWILFLCRPHILKRCHGYPHCLTF